MSEITAQELEVAGVSREEVERQLALLREPPQYVDLVRSCSLDDGVETARDADGLRQAYESARLAGRLSLFVPASGAASRMFQAVQRCAAESDLSLQKLRARAGDGDADARLTIRVVDGIEDLAFAPELAAAMGVATEGLAAVLRAGEWKRALQMLAGNGGLAYASHPKGLLPFHRYANGPRTAFAEHLDESTDLVCDAQGVCRAHFTISTEHGEMFAAALRTSREAVESRSDLRLEVSFSAQKPSTNTVALAPDGRVFRDDEGVPVFRPGGHGALLGNLGEAGADIAFLQNIDNIQPRHRRAPGLLLKQGLIGRLVLLQEEVFPLVRRLRAGETDADTIARAGRLAAKLGAAATDGDARAQSVALLRFLDRPMRVCGVVRNTGEPGGGPFWVRGRDARVTRQIVESAQVDPSAEEQQAIFAGASHFNPVLIACGLRDCDGKAFDLPRYVDHSAVFISRKSLQGRELVALELPGLWNGAMADWLSLFVEVSIEAFAPVKTIADLLRPEHREVGEPRSETRTSVDETG